MQYPVICVFWCICIWYREPWIYHITCYMHAYSSVWLFWEPVRCAQPSSSAYISYKIARDIPAETALLIYKQNFEWRYNKYFFVWHQS